MEKIIAQYDPKPEVLDKATIYNPQNPPAVELEIDRDYKQLMADKYLFDPTPKTDTWSPKRQQQKNEKHRRENKGQYWSNRPSYLDD
jgi:hypothetical protein